MVVEHFARRPLLGPGFPQDGIQVREVVVYVDPDVAPAAQRPAAQLGTLESKTTNAEISVRVKT